MPKTQTVPKKREALPVSDGSELTESALGVAQEYVALEKEIRELERQLKTRQERQEKLGQRLLSTFGIHQIQSLNIGGMTVYVSRLLTARPRDGDWERLCKAFRRNGLAPMVQTRINLQTLGKYVRDLDQQGEPMPKGVASAIETNEIPQIRVRSS